MDKVNLDELPPRDSKGRFSTLRCVNAHDRCFGGAGGPCPYCEVREHRTALQPTETHNV